MLSKDEANAIKTDIALLKKSTSDTLNAIESQASSQKELLQSVNGLTIEIREDRARREAHDEKRDMQELYVQEQIKSNTKRLDYFAENYKQSIERMIVSQKRMESLITAIFSKAGATIMITVIVLFLFFMGINPKDFKI